MSGDESIAVGGGISANGLLLEVRHDSTWFNLNSPVG